MKLMHLWLAAALATSSLIGATAANAERLVYDPAVGGYVRVSDFPYAAAPPPPVVVPGPRYGAGPLLPSTEVYAVMRETGFSPLGIPELRGVVYVITALDRNGDDGRLVIDARDGRILRFTPAWRMRDGYDDYRPRAYPGPGAMIAPPAGLPAAPVIRGMPRPPGSDLSTRTVPLPRPAPSLAARTPEPQSRPAAPAPAAAAGAKTQSPATASQPAAAAPAAAEARPAAPVQSAAAPSVPATGTVGQARPAPQLLPTQEMPKAQGLD